MLIYSLRNSICTILVYGGKMKAYQLKITIKDTKPPIWRRVIIPEKITFEQLHLTIQSAFCWDNYHMYEFEFPETGIHVTDHSKVIDGYEDTREIDSSKLIDELLTNNNKFKYVYDFGDWWEHTIIVEKILTDYGERYPQVIKYKGNVIPEDCGGPFAYDNLLHGDPAVEEDREDWDELQKPIDYDMGMVNEQMKNQLIFPKTKKKKRTSSVKKADLQEDYIQNFIQDFLKYAETNVNKSKIGSLEEIYIYYSKEDLIDIAKIHHMEGYSKYKKEKLIPRIISYILEEEEMKRYFICLHDSEIKVFEQALREEANKFSPLTEDLSYLSEGGYCGFTDKLEVVVPTDVATMYKKINSKEFQNKRKRLNLINRYCKIANYLYAVTPIDRILQLFNQNENKKLSKDELLNAYSELKLYRCEFSYIDDMFVDLELIHDHIYKNILKLQGDQPYYLPDKAEIESLSQVERAEVSDEIGHIYEFLLQNTSIDETEVITLCNQIANGLRIGHSTNDIIKYMNQNNILFKKKKESEEFTRLLMEAWNQTRMILYRGYKPVELERVALDKKTENVKEDRPRQNKSKSSKNKIILFSDLRKDK